MEPSKFVAAVTREGVEGRWTINSEIDNLGFNVYRSTKGETGYARVNRELVKWADTTPSHTKYLFVDRYMEVNHAYYYKFEDVSLHGHRRLHRPVRVFVRESQLAQRLSLGQNFANPFPRATRFRFGVPERLQVRLSIIPWASSFGRSPMQTRVQERTR